MKLVVSGYYGYDNLGDEAILLGMLRTIRSEVPAAELTVLSGNPPSTELTHGVAAIHRTDARAVVGALRASDGLISGGGGLLQDRTSARPVAYYAAIAHLARLLGRRYVVHAQGLGPIDRAPNRWIAASTLRGAAHCSLRDPGSIDLARAIGVRRPISLVPDAALGLVRTATARTDRIVVAVRSWPSSHPYLATIRDAVAELAGERPIVALPMQPAADVDASRAVIDGIPGAEMVSPHATIEERIDAIATAGVVVGMRLHALILAAGAGVPAVAVSYDPKVRAFADQVGQPVVGDTDRPMEASGIAAGVRAATVADDAPTRERVEAMRGTLRDATRRSLAALRGDA